jgi:hypothetical protein
MQEYFFSLFNYKRGLTGAAWDYFTKDPVIFDFTIWLWNSPVQIDLRN